MSRKSKVFLFLLFNFYEKKEICNIVRNISVEGVSSFLERRYSLENILEFLKEKKVLCAVSFLSLSLGAIFSFCILEVTAEESYTCPLVNSEVDEVEAEAELFIVDVKGAVVNPGVYRVQKGTIIQDVLTLAGGITKQADTSNLNLSKKVSNEMVITVFTKEEIEKEKLEKEPIQEQEASETLGQTTLVSLNTGTLEELTTLKGIGEAKAKIIIEYREKCGKFKKKEELKNIKGIGEAIYEKIKDYITI